MARIAATGPIVEKMAQSDLRFVVWVVSRNAYTLLTRPWRLFDAEQCHPAANALALGEPAITLGLLGTAGYAVSRDPIATFNWVLLAIGFAAPFAMYLLVREWTGEPAAGVVAGLYYGFHGLKLANAVHPYVWDNAWTVLALLFAYRFFEKRRWSDAVVLAVCCVLQLGGSLYPLLGSLAVGLPVLLWLLVRRGFRRSDLAPALFVLLAVALAGVLFFRPYLEGVSAGDLQRRAVQVFMPWSDLLPGARAFPGWSFLALAILGLALPGRHEGGDPRWAMLAGWLLAAYLAAGGTAGEELLAGHRGESLGFRLPNLYGALAGFVPGLDVVRVPSALYSGAHLALGVLVGLGAAAILRRVPARLWAPAAAALVALAWIDALRPSGLGLEPRFRHEEVSLRPAPEVLDFFEELEARGNAGPLFEVPISRRRIFGESRLVLRSAYHHRRTSSCASSNRHPRFEELERLAGELPAREAVRALAEMGFTTVLVHHPGPRTAGSYASRLEARLAEGDDAPLRRVYGIGSMTAYEIDVESADVPSRAF